MYFRTRKRHVRVFKKIVKAPLITIYEYYMNHTVFKMKPLLLLIVLSSSISLTNFQKQKCIFLLCFYHNLQYPVTFIHSTHFVPKGLKCKTLKIQLTTRDSFSFNLQASHSNFEYICVNKILFIRINDIISRGFIVRNKRIVSQPEVF
jgi:hypothetical protein